MGYTHTDVVIYEINIARARIGKMTIDAIGRNDKECVVNLTKADRYLQKAIESIQKGEQKND